eukprot:scaffold20348_cov54-Phaeocystis_antarctica.AAC.1
MCVGPNAPTHAGPGRGVACTRLGGSSSCCRVVTGLESGASARAALRPESWCPLGCLGRCLGGV